MPYYPLARLILTDSFNRIWIGQARTRFGVDSVTILRQGVRITTLQQAVEGGRVLDSIRLKQLAMYRAGEDTLIQRVATAERAARRTNNRTRFTAVAGIILAVVVLVLK